MPETINADLCIIGAGSAGLSLAAVAAQMGARTVLIESGRMGGDCLNAGCVPSKSLLAAAHRAHIAREAGLFGVDCDAVKVDYSRVHAHVHAVIGGIAPHDSEERFRSLGCVVLRDPARFIGPRAVTAGHAEIVSRRFVVATGSRAAVPDIPGLRDTAHLTNESIFDLTECPRHLVIIGGGPIGCEMAQAFRRLGAAVTLLDVATILPKDDPEAVAVVRSALTKDGVVLREKVKIDRVAPTPSGVAIFIGGETIEGSHLLVAAGRRPNVENLGLEAAGIEYGPKGIVVDNRLRTTNKRVFASGDVAGGPQFTHVAGYHAGIIVRNALLRWPSRVDLRALPWVTYTDPELAQVGVTEAQARARHGDAIKVLRADFSESDRARAERSTDGFVKAVTDRRGRILGATIVGSHAGELIQPWGLAISSGLRVGSMAQMIAPYPTLGEINKRAAGEFYRPTVFGDRMRRIVRLLGRFG